MTIFNFQPRVGDSDKKSCALGVSNAAKFGDNDLNKVVKLVASGTYGPVSTGNDIEGIVLAIAPNTVNDGFSFGTIQDGGRLVAQATDVTPLAIGAQVIAAAQNALGTAQDFPLVKLGTGGVFKWRVIDLLTGAGAQNTNVVIERCPA